MRSAIAWLGKTKRLWALAAFLLVLFVLVRVTGLRDHMTLAFVHDQFEAHMVQGLLLFVLLFCLGNLVQIPGWIFLAAAVLALGKFWGGLVTYVAAVTSCAFTFWVIRLLGGNALREFRGKLVQRLLARMDAHPVASVVLLRTLLQTAPALNYALAMSGLKFRAYILGTLLGLPLPIALYSLFFETIARVLHLPMF